MTAESEGVLSVELVHPDGASLPGWEPGAHIDLVLADGLVRPYSLSGDPHDHTRYRLGVLREPAGRGGSEHVHTVLRPGDRVEVRGPRNHFRLAEAEHYVFIAGGIGITPILPMVAAAVASGARWSLLYGGRTASSMAFTEELARHGERVWLCPQDTDGLLPLDSVLATPRANTLVYCCGPEALLAAVEERCAGWPAGALHTERFAAPAREPRVEQDGEVEVVLAASGGSVFVPAELPILDVLLESGIDVLNDCREGICGSCETKVLDGEVDHRDFVLSEAERRANNCMMVCVSRACGSRLVLDL
ncbi:MAG: PDR/VanB family oxidoreductase [Sciscionella sp.]